MAGADVSATASGHEPFSFRLFIASGTPNSALATANLAALCKTQFANRCTIELVDVFAEPHRALSDGIFMTPTLVKLSPGPVGRCVGTLSDAPSVLAALGIEELVP
ncbi:MAG: circadian clock protein KaiB [Comamonadaceae bacterium]|nr:MAG: circadian clock protein KaiB [Comamonadaceae bacterium]